MATIGDKFSQLGTSIINLVGTRASRNMDNLTTVGRANIATLASGISQSAVGNVCTSATNPAYSGTFSNQRRNTKSIFKARGKARINKILYKVN